MNYEYAGYQAYWSGLKLQDNPAEGLSRTHWISGWERARKLDDKFSPQLGYQREAHKPKPKRESVSAQLTKMYNTNVLRFLPSEIK